MSEVGGFYDNPWVDFVFDDLNAANSFRDLFKELISHVEKQPGETRRPFIVTINQFRILVDKYSKGEATLRDLRDFDAGILSGTTQWEDVYNSVLDEEGQAPQDWEKIKEILRRNGYSESEIQSVENGFHKTGAYEDWLRGGGNPEDFEGQKFCHDRPRGNTSYDDDCQFRGNMVLPGILGDLGYEGGDWWDVRPQTGSTCDTGDPDKPLGETDADGNCNPLADADQPGQPCEPAGSSYANGEINDQGECVEITTKGTPCDVELTGSTFGGTGSSTSNIPGTRDEDGNCVAREQDGDECVAEDGSWGQIENGTCVSNNIRFCDVVNEDNAEDCGYDLDNLVDCGDGTFAPSQEECGGPKGLLQCADGTLVSDQSLCDATLEDVLKGLADEFGESAVEVAEEVYDYVKDKFEEIKDAATDPQKALEILTEILTGGFLVDDERCFNDANCGKVVAGVQNPPCTLTNCTEAGNPDETGKVCWKDCTNFVGVLAIPGLPMPPGIGELATVRDLEDFLKGIGKSVEDFFEDPAGTVEGWIGDLIEKIKGVFDVDLEDGSKILDWLKGIFGAAVGAWVWEQIEEEASEVFFNIIPGSTDYGLCPDGETPKTDEDGDDCPLPAVNCADLGKTGGLVYREEECGEFLTNCADLGKQGGLVENPDTECGPCLSTHILEGDNCVAWEDEGPTEEQCAAQNKVHIPSPAAGTKSQCGGCLDPNTYQLNEDGDCVLSTIICEGDQVLNSTETECVDPVDCVKGNACRTDDNREGVYGEDCECIPNFINEGPTPDQCDALDKFHIPADPVNNEFSKCGDCKQPGYTSASEDAPCTPPETDCSEINEGNYEQCNKVKCPDGKFNPVDGSSYADSQEDCVGRGDDTPDACPDGTPKTNYEGQDCDGPCVEGFVKKGSSCVPQCQITGKGDLAASDEGCREDDGPDPEGVDCNDLVGLSQEDHEACGHVQCPDDSDRKGQWFPKGSNVETACYDTSVVEECVDESGNPTGAINYPECNLCDTGFKFNGTKCVPDVTPPPPEPPPEPPPPEDCRDPNSTTYGQPGACGPCKETFQKIGDLCQCPEGTREEQGRCVSVPTGNPCVDEDGYAESNPIECGWKHCGGGVYVPPEKDCPITVDPCVDEPGYDKDHPQECGWTDCGDGTFVHPDEECGPTITKCEDEDAINYLEDGPCVFGPTPEKCDDPTATNYGEDGPCVYGPTPEKCDDPTATNFGQDGPCTYGPTPVKCDDPTATNFGEDGPCVYGPDCNDCSCPQYAEQNPLECITEPPPPTPPPPGGGGGGGIGDGMFAPRPTWQRQPFVAVEYKAPVKAMTVLNKFIENELKQPSLLEKSNNNNKGGLFT